VLVRPIAFGHDRCLDVYIDWLFETGTRLRAALGAAATKAQTGLR
jgi:hypothetical protein